MRIICLANSRKHGGRCIAGIDNKGNWIRPISSSSKRAISRQARNVNGLEPEVLDILEIPLHEHGSVEGCQPENRLLKEGIWGKKGKIKPKELLRYCEKDSPILHNDLDYVRSVCFRAIPTRGWKSLQLIHNNNVSFKSDKHSKEKYRADCVTSKRKRMSLVVTDPVICEKLRKNEKVSNDCLLTVSLAPGWSPSRNIPKRCYKFVAGVIELSRP